MEEEITFGYVNWRGEVGMRRVRPLALWFGSTKYHPKPQWLLKGLDLDKEELRDFAMTNISNWRSVL